MDEDDETVVSHGGLLAEIGFLIQVGTGKGGDPLEEAAERAIAEQAAAEKFKDVI